MSPFVGVETACVFVCLYLLASSLVLSLLSYLSPSLSLLLPYSYILSHSSLPLSLPITLSSSLLSPTTWLLNHKTSMQR